MSPFEKIEKRYKKYQYKVLNVLSKNWIATVTLVTFIHCHLCNYEPKCMSYHKAIGNLVTTGRAHLQASKFIEKEIRFSTFLYVFILCCIFVLKFFDFVVFKWSPYFVNMNSCLNATAILIENKWIIQKIRKVLTVAPLLCVSVFIVQFSYFLSKHN